MRTHSNVAIGLSLLLAVIFLAVRIGEAVAAPTPKPVEPEKKHPVTVKFKSDNRSLRPMLNWLTEATGKPVIAPVMPSIPGCFIGPDKVEYSVPEVIDIVNEVLMRASPGEHYLLVQRKHSYIMLNVNEVINPALLPHVRPDDLKDHGNSELVSMFLPLTSLDAARIAPSVKKLLGPLGEAIPVKQAGVNQLMLLDTVGNLKRVRDEIQELEKKATEN